MTGCHDAVLSRQQIQSMSTDTSPVSNEAIGVRTADHFVDLVQRSRLDRAHTWLSRASIDMGPRAWIGVRSVVLIIVSMLMILVWLPAALVAAGN